MGDQNRHPNAHVLDVLVQLSNTCVENTVAVDAKNTPDAPTLATNG